MSGVLIERRGRALRNPTAPRPASALASAMTPSVRLSLNYCSKITSFAQTHQTLLTPSERHFLLILPTQGVVIAKGPLYPVDLSGRVTPRTKN